MIFSRTLYGRIIFWLILNFILLATIGAAFFFVGFGPRPLSLLDGPLGDHAKTIANEINAELDQSPRTDWTSVLTRVGAEHGLTFALFVNGGANGVNQVAGAPTELPSSVRELVFRRPGPEGRNGPPRRPGPPPRDGPLPRDGVPPGPGRDRPPEFGDRPPPPPDADPLDEGGEPEGRDRPPTRPAGDRPIGEVGPQNFRGGAFFLRAGEPARYWVGVRVPVRIEQRGQSQPGTLIAETNSLWALGWFIGVQRWIAAALGVVLLSALFWWPFVRRVTASVKDITAATEGIAEGRLDARAKVTRSDELGRLSQAVNQMAERLQGFVSGQKRFVGDIAHELCSPLARLQFALGILEQRLGDGGAAALTDVRDEIQQLSDMVNELLQFSKAALHRRDLELAVVPLRELTERVLEREHATDRVQLNIGDALAVRAEPNLLARAIANLVRNAIRYAGDAGPIVVSAAQEGASVLVTVADEGPGVPAEALVQLGDPFFRPESARTRETGGVGLGLAIVKTCIEACRGTVRLQNRTPRGLEVTIKLDAA